MYARYVLYVCYVGILCMNVMYGMRVTHVCYECDLCMYVCSVGTRVVYFVCMCCMRVMWCMYACALCRCVCIHVMYIWMYGWNTGCVCVYGL